jgi:proline iminopeptidase
VWVIGVGDGVDRLTAFETLTSMAADEYMVTLADGTQLWAAVSGTGPPAVCCHGGPGLWDYLGSLSATIDDAFSVIRFDQRGCGRSGGLDGPFTIAQALLDLDDVRAFFGFPRWTLIGHSWGAELVLRYAARFPQYTAGTAYIAGVGAGRGYHDAYVGELTSRLGPDLSRWTALKNLRRTEAEEREFCLLQWRCDFSPTAEAFEHATALWQTRPPGAMVNIAANAELWADRSSEDLLAVAASIDQPVTLLFGADDPRPWSATTTLVEALPQPRRFLLQHAGHAPWIEQPEATRRILLQTLLPTVRD